MFRELVDGVEIQWVSNFYDHPLSGMARKDGEDYWFIRADDWETFGSTIFLYKLHPNDEAEIRYQHERFEKYVNAGWCYHLPPEKRVLRPYEGHGHFYDLYPPVHWEHILARAALVATYEIPPDLEEE